MYKKSKLAAKFIIGFVLLGVLICSVSSAIGYNQYKSSIEERYNDMAYQCASVALSYVKDDTLDEYVRLVTGYKAGTVTADEIKKYADSEEYVQTRERIVTLRSEMGANDIYIGCIDVDEMLSFNGNLDGWSPAVYIFDSFRQTESSFSLGDTSPLNPAYIEDAYNILTTGKRSDNYFFSEGEFGYNTSAILPVERDGKVIAVVGVEIPMTTLQALLHRYMLFAILITIIMTVIFLVCYMLYLYKSMISPINIITAEAKSFAESREQNPKVLESIKTKDEIQSLASTIKQMQIDITDYIDNLAAITAEKERIGAELNVAAQIQANMLPSIFPAFPERKEFDIYATMLPAKEVGGDFYDFFMIDSDHLAVVMADVSGKGVPAALFMVIAKTLIKNRAQMLSGISEKYSPSEILGYVNDQLCEGNEAELFVTVWLCVIEISTGKCTASNAGHEYPAIRRVGGKFEIYKTKNSPAVAAMEGMKFREYEFELNPGDSLYIYTDGVAEAADAQNNMFGTDRMTDALNTDPDASPEKILGTVKEQLDKFVGDAPQFDDITMLGLKYYGKDAAK